MNAQVAAGDDLKVDSPPQDERKVLVWDASYLGWRMKSSDSVDWWLAWIRP